MQEIDADRLVDAFGNVPGNLLTAAFLLLNPARLLFDKYFGFLENMDNKEFVENFIRMEKWIFDSPDVPGETLRQLIKDLYQQNLLMQGKLRLGEHRVDLQRLTMPLLNIYGQYDHLVPPEACEVLTERVGSRDTKNVCLDTGHVGIYVRSQFQKEMVPNDCWLAAGQGRLRSIRRRAQRKKVSATQGKSISMPTTNYFKNLCEARPGLRHGPEPLRTPGYDLPERHGDLKGKAACLYLTEPAKGAYARWPKRACRRPTSAPGSPGWPERSCPSSRRRGFFLAGTPRRTPNWTIPRPSWRKASPPSWRCRCWSRAGSSGSFASLPTAPGSSADESEVPHLLAQQGGGVMEHAHLIDQLRQETKLFFDLAVNLSGSLDVKEILDAMTTDLARALGVKAASIRLLDEAENLELVASSA